jgi:anti-anti-sigma factor
MRDHTLEVESTELGALGTVLHLAGEPDARALPRLRAELARAAAPGKGPLVVDLTHTRFVDSALVRTLLASPARSLRGTPLVVVAGAPDTRQPFELAAVDGSVRLASSFAEALRGLCSQMLHVAPERTTARRR